MKVLFTKKIEEREVVNQLGHHHEYAFLEVIKTHSKSVSPYPLSNSSLIFTSVNGVDSFFKNDFKPNEDFTSSHYNKIYAVGLKTKRELRKHGFGTFKVFSSAAEMSEFIMTRLSYEKFIHFCGNMSLNILTQSLPLQNIKYKKEVIYTTEELYPKYEENYDAAVFFSPSGVRSFVKNNSIEGKKLFAIGKTTESELRKYTEAKIDFSLKNNLSDLLRIMKSRLSEV